MGIFDRLKKKNEPDAPAPMTFPAVLGAAATGDFVPMSEIPDEVFSTGVIGSCCGIAPNEGKVYAPIDGKVSQVADSLHAIGIDAGELEILIHVGIDTVAMNGDGFSAKVKVGSLVKKGDLLLTMDLEKIKAAGHPTTVIMALTNSDDFASVETVASGTIHPGDDLLRISK